MHIEIPDENDTLNTKTIGSLEQCDLQIEGETVSDIHAQAQVNKDGFITIVDAGSDHGTFLQRNDQWIRIMKADLGTGDRIRCGKSEIELERLLKLFGERVRVQLRDGNTLRLPALLAERLADSEARVTLERPRRNPETGNIEEDI